MWMDRRRSKGKKNFAEQGMFIWFSNDPRAKRCVARRDDQKPSKPNNNRHSALYLL